MRLFRLTLATASLMMGLPLGFVRAAPVLNEAAPPLVVTTLEGQPLDLSNLRGKVVLVNYWATWCAPCRKEMPMLDAFYRRYQSQGLELIGISVDFTRDGAKIRKAAKDVAYPIALSSEVSVNGFGPSQGVPVTYVIDADGIVRGRFGAVPRSLLNDVVIPLLPRPTAKPN
jgi:cytochrome c biogenesis protein CcmG/thiol:disulfide interchange protein DsbE